MNLIWKLLRQHISIPQFVGFFFANLFGVMIVLFGFQFYRDILPIFTGEDSFMKSNYLIIPRLSVPVALSPVARTHLQPPTSISYSRSLSLKAPDALFLPDIVWKHLWA